MIHHEKHLIVLKGFPRPESLAERMQDLKTRGYPLSFRREASCLRCFELKCDITPDDFSIDEYYRFTDTSNTDRERILYAVSSVQGLKGCLVDACFVYEENISPEMAHKLYGSRLIH